MTLNSGKFTLIMSIMISMLFWSFKLSDRPSSGHSKEIYYTNKAKKYLIKHDVLWDYINISETGIDIFATPQDKKTGIPECRLYWDEIETFTNICKDFRYEDAFATYKNKSTKRFSREIVESVLPVNPGSSVLSISPLPLSGKRIAIDPGHIGNNIEMGLIESRFVKMNVGHDEIQFNEGELTYVTALTLKKQLESQGAEVLITRRACNASSLGITFQEWYNTRMSQDLEEAVLEGRISKEVAYWLKNEASPEKVFQKFFQHIDWRERSKLINNFKPDLTVIIHYNADEDNKDWVKPTEKNYNVAFVGGGYVKDELRKIEDRFQFLRQLVSHDLENSMRFSGLVIKSFEECLKVPTITKQDETNSIKNFSMPTVYKGVYSRNLALTRYVMGTVCYGESLLQDNINETKLLNKRDLDYSCGKTSSRVKDVANAYYKGILEYYKNETFTKL